MEEIYHISSIAEAYQFMGAGKAPHPLITIIRQWPDNVQAFKNIKFTSDLYYMALKRNISGSFQYGRNSYDYQEGTMVFIAPGQVASFTMKGVAPGSHGWTILFHPDLIRKSKLGESIRNYSFFNYEINEALHLSEKERQFLNTLVDTIEQEINQNMDRHSQELIIQNIETILKYCDRYYDRQFYTRSNLNKGLIGQFERFLHSYFTSGEWSEKGIPSIDTCGAALNLSGAYLSDLLRNETGKSAKDHIYNYLIENAKTILLNSGDSISQVAYRLGFEYPQNFSKLFKAKVGLSPSEYRNLN